MFTFGIFTTHLPYIAFVLFYGFFFIAGIEKASAGDFGEGHQIIPKVISVSDDNYCDNDGNASITGRYFTKGTEFEQLLLYEGKIKQFYSKNKTLKTALYRLSWFSRPPPVALAKS